MTPIIHGERWHPWRRRRIGAGVKGGCERVSASGVYIRAYFGGGGWYCEVDNENIGDARDVAVSVDGARTRTIAFRAAMSAYNIAIGRKP